MKSEQVKELARKITDRVARDSISIAIARNDMKWDKEDCTEEEIITDTLNVVLGDDTGCLDEDELTPGNCSVKFVEAALEQAEREAVGPACNRCGQPQTPTWTCNPCIDVIGREVTAEIKAESAPRPEASTREALKYARHLPSCKTQEPNYTSYPIKSCTCGLEAALAAQPQREVESRSTLKRKAIMKGEPMPTFGSEQEKQP